MTASRPFSDRSSDPVRQLALDLPHEASHAIDDFITGEGNRLALRRILAFPDWPDPLTLVVGPPKAGKSHLARVFADESGARFVAPDDLGATLGDGADDPLILEDIERAGYAETELFHLVNRAMRDRRALLMTARTEVEDMGFVTNDLRSRLRRAIKFTISTSDDIGLSQMLAKLFADRQLAVEPRVLSYIAQRMERSTEEAVALCALMDRLALSRGTAVTRAVAADALALRAGRHGAGRTDDPGDDET